MKPVDDRGRLLDATFGVEPVPNGAYLTLESRGGGVDGPRPPRNADYAPALELLLQRLGEQGATLTDIEVYSRVTQKWPVEKRRISAHSFPLPLELSAVTQVRDFRRELGRASTELGRPLGKTGGNPTKRLRLTLEWPQAKGKSAQTLEELLARGG